MFNRVYITVGGCVCPHCGFVASARYEAQNPAPCGCAWVWDEQNSTESGNLPLVAIPSKNKIEVTNNR